MNTDLNIALASRYSEALDVTKEERKQRQSVYFMIFWLATVGSVRIVFFHGAFAFPSCFFQPFFEVIPGLRAVLNMYVYSFIFVQRTNRRTAVSWWGKGWVSVGGDKYTGTVMYIKGNNPFYAINKFPSFWCMKNEKAWLKTGKKYVLMKKYILFGSIFICFENLS